MALNLKTLGTRTLSGIVFIILLMGSVLFNYYSFTVFFFIIALIGLTEFYKIAQKLNAQPYKYAGYVCAGLVYFAFVNFSFLVSNFNINFSYLLVLIPFIIFLVALFSTKQQPLKNAFYTLGGLLYAVLPFALLTNFVIVHQVNNNEFQFFPKLLLGIIFLIWSNDTFAYLGGSLFGKHKMIERISPGKTWEGTIFGIVVSFGISVLIQRYFIQTQNNIWLALGIIVPILATLGDLVESMLKRQAGIKDSGNIMPGHGGVLDRFDSLIFVSPFVYVIFKCL